MKLLRGVLTVMILKSHWPNRQNSGYPRVRDINITPAERSHILKDMELRQNHFPEALGLEKDQEVKGR